MGDCPYYHLETKRFESREITSDQQGRAPTIVKIPWCAHAHSAAPEQIKHGGVGVANLLRCGGDLAKCQVEPQFR
jgi:hypothetical protein